MLLFLRHYPRSPAFRDGVISVAVDEAVGSGSLYFSSAGNDGSGYRFTSVSVQLQPRHERRLLVCSLLVGVRLGYGNCTFDASPCLGFRRDARSGRLSRAAALLVIRRRTSLAANLARRKQKDV